MPTHVLHPCLLYTLTDLLDTCGGPTLFVLHTRTSLVLWPHNITAGIHRFYLFSRSSPPHTSVVSLLAYGESGGHILLENESTPTIHSQGVAPFFREDYEERDLSLRACSLPFLQSLRI